MADSVAQQNASASLMTNGVISLVVQGKPAEALGWMLRARAVDPQNSFINRYGSTIFGALDLLPEAMRLREDMLQWAYMSLTMWPELLADSHESVADDPSNPEKQLYLADALHLSGEIEEAQALYEDLLLRAQGRVIRDGFRDSGAPTARAAFGRFRAGDRAGAALLAELAGDDQRQKSLAGRRNGEYFRTAALLEALDGNETEALNNIEYALAAGLTERSVFSEPAFESFRESPEFVALAVERKEALQMLCFSNPVAESWQPLAETCEGVTAR